MSLHKDLSNTFDDVDKKINGSKAQTAESDVREISEKIDTTVDEINFQISNLTDKIQNILEDLDESPIKTGAFHGLRALVLAPCVLVAVPSLAAIIFGLCRFSLSDSGCSKRSRIYNCGGIFAMFGVFCGFVFGWIVILVATLSFLGGYGMEMVCKPLFDDPHMRLLHSIPTFKFEVPPLYDSNSATIIEFDEVLMQCNQHLSIFTALNGNTIMNVSAILQQANLEKYKEEAIDKFNKQSFNYVLNETYSNLLDNATSQLQAAVDKLETHLNKTTAAAGNDTNKTDQVKDVEETLEKMKSVFDDLIDVMSETLNDVKNVSTVALNSGNFTDKGVKMITRIFDDTIENVTEKVYAAKDQLLMNTSDCYPLYEVWQTVGFTLCDRVGKPLQGMWASAGLAAIFIVVLIVALIPVAKYLQHTEPRYNRFGAKHARPHVSNHLRYNRTNKAQQPPAVTKTTIATTERLYATRSSPYSYVNNGYYSYSKPIYNRSQYH
uniref:Uncharacterized protein n=1 Tax=Parascaris univalens TaxID=6257 RepID=A0A915BVS9_PARUN